MVKAITIGFCLLLFPVCRVLSQQVTSTILDTVCGGTSHMFYSVEEHPGSIYHWKVEGGNIQSGDSTNKIEVSWDKKPGLFRISIVEQNQLKCVGDTVYAFIFIRGRDFKVNYPSEACVDDSLILRASGGSNYLWNFGPKDSTVAIKLLSDTTFTVIISDTICTNRTDTLQLAIKAHARPEAGITSNTKEIYKDQLVDFSYSGNQQDKVNWDIEKADIFRQSGGSINVKFVDTGLVAVKLFSMNIHGCVDSTTELVNVKDEQFFIPNAFTPNGDGLNDELKPIGTGIKSYHIAIYNRWGEKVFETSSPNESWNGTYHGEPVGSDIYVYQGEAVGHSGRIINFTGNITILR